jgi:hypothetical protein
MPRNKTLNCPVINLYFLLFLLHRLKLVEESVLHNFFPDIFVLYGDPVFFRKSVKFRLVSMESRAYMRQV